MRNLERSGFEGPVWGVNPRRTEVLGRPCVPSVADLPEPVDAVVVAIPAASVPATLAQAVERGCGGAVVLSAGFGEVESGRGLEQAMREVAQAGRLPVCGPNGNGIVATAVRAPMWGDSVPPLEPGRVAMVSQSGNLAVNALGSRRGIDWHTVVSTGNQAVCDASDWLAAICEQDGVGSVALFLESDGDGAKLAEALARCADAGVGVAVLKVGTSEAGARAAAAHTGALAGDQRVFRALVEEAGAAWAADPHELLELAKSLAEPRARPDCHGGLAVLTCSGGDSGIAADEAQAAGLALPALQPETEQRLAELLPDAATIANPLDYTAMIWGDTELLRRIVATVGADPGIDQLLLLYDHPHDLSPESEASWTAVRAGILAGAAEVDSAALVASTLPDLIEDHACRQLAAHGVPAIAGLRTALRCARALRSAPGDPARLRAIAAVAGRAAARDRDEPSPRTSGSPRRRRSGCSPRRGSRSRPAGWRCDADDAVAVAAEEVGHRSRSSSARAGPAPQERSRGPRAGPADEAAVRDAFVRLRLASAGGARPDAGRAHGPRPASSCSSPPAPTGSCLRWSSALGGIWTEALDDVAIVPLPAGPERVERALRSLRGAPVLTGGRGRAAIDLDRRRPDRLAGRRAADRA